MFRFLTRLHGRSRFDITDVLSYLYLSAGVVVMFGPVLWLVMSSFKHPSLINKKPITFLPYRQDTVSIDDEDYQQALPVYDVTWDDGSSRHMAALLDTGGEGETSAQPKEWRPTEKYIYMIDVDQPGEQSVPVLEQDASPLYTLASVEGRLVERDSYEESFIRVLDPTDLDAQPILVRSTTRETIRSDSQTPGTYKGAGGNVLMEVPYTRTQLKVYDVDLPDGTFARMAALVDPNGSFQVVHKSANTFVRMMPKQDAECRTADDVECLDESPIPMENRVVTTDRYSPVEVWVSEGTLSPTEAEEALEDQFTSLTIDLGYDSLALTLYRYEVDGEMQEMIQLPGVGDVKRRQFVKMPTITLVNLDAPGSEPIQLLSDDPGLSRVRVQVEGYERELLRYDVKLDMAALPSESVDGALRLLDPSDPDAGPQTVLADKAHALYDVALASGPVRLAQAGVANRPFYRMIDPDNPGAPPVMVLKNNAEEIEGETVAVTFETTTLTVYEVMLEDGTPAAMAALVDPDGSLQEIEIGGEVYLRMVPPDDLGNRPELVRKPADLAAQDTGQTVDIGLQTWELPLFTVTHQDGSQATLAALMDLDVEDDVVIVDDPQQVTIPYIRKLYDPAFYNPESAESDVDTFDIAMDDPRLSRVTVAVPGYDEPLPLYRVERMREMAAVWNAKGDAPQTDQRTYVMMIDLDNPPEVPPSREYPYGATQVLRDNAEVVRSVYFDTGNYEGAIDSFDFLTYLRNSVIVTVGATAITLLINSMAAFGLSKYHFKGRNTIFLIIISTLMVPVSVILIPAFLVISEVGWANNLWGLIIPGAATPTGVFLLRQYMLTIPDELLDSARIDGASEWRIYWQVILPLARPALAVLAIFSVMWRWNDFLWPLIVVTRNDLYTLPVALNNFQGNLNVQWNYILAMTVLTLLPVTLVFAFLQRYITTGIATTGMK